MKKFFNILLAVLLVVPVLSVAAPCNMSMDKVEKHSMSQMMGDMSDCPHHQKQLSKNCEGMMSVADCYHLDMIASVDSPKTHDVLKSDVMPAALFVSNLLDEPLLINRGVHAPPLVQEVSYFPRSIVLTTQRFRI